MIYTPVPPDLQGLGLPFSLIRDGLKDLRRSEYFELSNAIDAFGLRVPATLVIVNGMITAGYVTTHDVNKALYSVTDKGYRLASKNLTRVSAKTIENLKVRVLAAVQTIANDPVWEYEFTKVAFFGSAAFRENQQDYGDLDVGVDYAQKRRFADYATALHALRDRLVGTPGYRDFFDLHPQIALLKHLRKLSSGGGLLSLHEMDEVNRHQFAHIVVYERPA